jgi:hypothetical protein
VVPGLPLKVFSVTGKKKHRRSSAFFYHIAGQGITNDTMIILTAGQYAARFVIALLPVRFVHAGNGHTAAGGGMYKLVIANVNANMSTCRTRTEQD